MWRNIASNAITLLILAVLGLAILVGWGQRQFTGPGPLEEAIYFEVPRGATIRTVSRDLTAAGAISSDAIFRIGADYTEMSDDLKFGTYEIPAGASMEEILAIVTKAGAAAFRYVAEYVIGVSEANLRAIAARAEQYGLQTAMLEHIGSGYEDLHQDLKIGRNSAWQQFTLGFCTGDNAAQYYWIDDNDPTVKMGKQTRFLRHYFRYIRRDAVRIEAIASNPAFDPLAFVNADGRYTAVVKTTTGAEFSVQSLPAGTYGVYYTLFNETETDRPDLEVTLTEAGSLRAAIPGAGLVTIYQKDLPSAAAPAGQTEARSTPRKQPCP